MGDLAPGGPNEANEVVAVALTVRSCSIRLGQAGAQAFVSTLRDVCLVSRPTSADDLKRGGDSSHTR